jgi:hypothetical protein
MQDIVPWLSSNNHCCPYTKAEKKAFYLGLLFWAQMHGKKPGMAFYKYQDKFGVKPPWDWQYVTPAPNEDANNYMLYSNIRHSKSRKKPRPTVCKWCDSNNLMEIPRPDTMHRAELWCGDCDRFTKWLPKESA